MEGNEYFGFPCAKFNSEGARKVFSTSLLHITRVPRLMRCKSDLHDYASDQYYVKELKFLFSLLQKQTGQSCCDSKTIVYQPK